MEVTLFLLSYVILCGTQILLYFFLGIGYTLCDINNQHMLDNDFIISLPRQIINICSTSFAHNVPNVNHMHFTKHIKRQRWNAVMHSQSKPGLHLEVFSGKLYCISHIIRYACLLTVSSIWQSIGSWKQKQNPSTHVREILIFKSDSVECHGKSLKTKHMLYRKM